MTADRLYAENKRVSLIVRLYIWSLIFESLLYFVIGSQQTTGINTSMGRLLQALNIALLVVYFISRPDSKLPNPFAKRFGTFTILFAIAVLSAMVGILNDSYTLENTGEYNKGFASSAVSNFLRSAFVRPFLEYVIYMYYIIYFVVMPYYMLKTESALFYFFKVFRIMFMAGLFLGLLDVFTYFLGFQFLARDMWGRVFVGVRFHGFAGEPRDAFVYVFYALCIFNLEQVYKSGTLIKKKYMIGMVALMLLTQSASGLLGVIIGGGLILSVIVSKLSIKRLLIGIAVVIVAGGVVTIGVLSSIRIQAYLEVISLVMEALENEVPPPLIFYGQMNNIYPLWDMYVKAKAYNFTTLLFGSGFGSASVANNNWGGFLWNELTNPHSQLIRILYETGIVGLILYIVVFFKKTKSLTLMLPAKQRQFFMYTMFLLIGMSLAHRSTTLFIYMGVLIAGMELYKKKRKKENSVNSVV